MTDAAATAGRDARLAWQVGGSLLIAHSVLDLMLSAAPLGPIPGAGYLVVALWAAALLVFALGIRRSGSVVARQRVGVVALVVAAAEPVVSRFLWDVIPLEVADPQLSIMVGQALQVLSLAALVVAAVVIGRAGAVPQRVRWLPLLVLAVTAAAQILLQIVAVAGQGAVNGEALTRMFWAASALGTIGSLILGILALVLAAYGGVSADHAVQVYPPSE